MFYTIGIMWEYIQPKDEGKVYIPKRKKNYSAIIKNSWTNQLR